jgi:NAD(P)-dependent dehydrogenase (short-subunit alcohol dehydrogenase family)
VVRRLGKTGAAVGVVARTEKALTKVAGDVRSLGGRILSLCADIAEPDAGRRVIEKTMARFGRITALVNNAGIVETLKPIAEANE